MTRFAKFYTAVTGALLTWGAVVVKSTPAAVTSTEWMLLAGGAVTALAVWFVPNSQVPPEVRWRAIDEYPIRGKPLGRHVHHDDASRGYEADQATALVTVEHARNMAALDQGALGSCTGNALTGALMTAPAWRAARVLDEGCARLLYSLGTRLDNGAGYWPPTDTGSSGLAVCKAAKNAGLISAYRHTFSLNGALGALVLGPVIIGISWYDSMDAPNWEGQIAISPGAQVRGGHEVELSLVDVPNKRVGGWNSWGPAWGNGGRFLMSWDTLSRLLAEQGDCTVPVP